MTMPRSFLALLFAVATCSAWAQAPATVQDGLLAAVPPAVAHGSTVVARPAASVPRMVMHAFPNPACDRVVLSAGVDRLTDVRLFDLSGHEVLAVQDMDMPAYLIDVSALGAGLYVVRATTQNGTITSTLAVE